MKYCVFSLFTLTAASLMASDDEHTPIASHTHPEHVYASESRQRTLAQRVQEIDARQHRYIRCGVDTQKYCCVNDCGNGSCCGIYGRKYYGSWNNLEREIRMSLRNVSEEEEITYRERLQNAHDKDVRCCGMAALCCVIIPIAGGFIALHTPAGQAHPATLIIGAVATASLIPMGCALRHAQGYFMEREIRTIAREQPQLLVTTAPTVQTMQDRQ